MTVMMTAPTPTLVAAHIAYGSASGHTAATLAARRYLLTRDDLDAWLEELREGDGGRHDRADSDDQPPGLWG